MAWWSSKLSGASSQGITRARLAALDRLMDAQIWCLSDSCMEGFSEKKRWLLLALFFCHKAALNLLPLCQTIQSLPTCPWWLLSCFQSLWVQVSPSTDPLRRTAWDYRSLHFPEPRSPPVFTARSYGDFSSWPWNPGDDVWMKPLTPQGGTPQQRCPSQFLSATHQCGTSPFHLSTPLSSLEVSFFLHPLL